MMKNKYLPYFLLLPLLILYIIPLILSLIYMIAQSLGYFPVLNMYSISLDYFIKAFGDELFIDSLKFSVYISTVTSLMSVSTGFFIAYILSKSKKSGAGYDVLKLPLLIPHFTAAFMVFLIFSQSGLASRVLGSLKLIGGQEVFPQLILDKNGIGIILSYLWKEIPFAALVIYTSIKGVSGKLKDVAYNLGASEFQFIKSVLLPICFPTMVSTFIILFGFSFGAFEVPYLVGPSYPKTLSILGYISYISPNLTDRPYAMTINVIITMMSFLLLVIYQKAAKAIKMLEG